MEVPYTLDDFRPLLVDVDFGTLLVVPYADVDARRYLSVHAFVPYEEDLYLGEERFDGLRLLVGVCCGDRFRIRRGDRTRAVGGDETAFYRQQESFDILSF